MSAAVFVGQAPGTQYLVGRAGPYGHTRVFLGHCATVDDSQLVSWWHRDAKPAAGDSLTIVTPDSAGVRINVVPLSPDVAGLMRRAVAAKKCRELTL